MASIDDTFGYIMSRAKAREKAMREALDNANLPFTKEFLLKHFQI